MFCGRLGADYDTIRMIKCKQDIASRVTVQQKYVNCMLYHHPIFCSFCYSSRVLFNMSQKLILRQLTNYTEILKWLREILACRNKFLNRHRDMANVGSSNKVCKHAHIKLEVGSSD